MTDTPIFIKDPNAILSYTIDWGTNYLGSDTIATSTWTVPTGITQTSASNDTTNAVIWLSGGTAGQQYEVTNRIVTAGGLTDERTLTIIVKDR